MYTYIYIYAYNMYIYKYNMYIYIYRNTQCAPNIQTLVNLATSIELLRTHWVKIVERARLCDSTTISCFGSCTIQVAMQVL